tara:strand:+ start:271 stop:531 length:261 start_codon:yes stop_codon:yes gene_type:complete
MNPDFLLMPVFFVRKLGVAGTEKSPSRKTRRGEEILRDLVPFSPDAAVGLELAPRRWIRIPTGCRGVTGPDPSTTLNEMLPKQRGK